MGIYHKYPPERRMEMETALISLHAAGETIDDTSGNRSAADNLTRRKIAAYVPDYLLHENLKLNLKHFCRQAIRKHLLYIDPHENLFGRVHQLGLPWILSA